MKDDHIKINKMFELIVNEGPYQGVYLSRIADLAKDNIKVNIPFVNGEIIPLRIGLAVEMYFTGEQAAYSYQTLITDRSIESVPLLTLKYPRAKRRIQRRDYFRLEVKKRVKYRLLDAELKPIGGFKETTTIDISGGGIKMVANSVIFRDTLMEVYLQIPTLENVAIISRAVNLTELPDGLALGIKFIEIDDSAREKIIGWLFEKQRKMRKKGLL